MLLLVLMLMLMLVGAFASRHPSLAAVAWIPELWPVDDGRPLTTAAQKPTSLELSKGKCRFGPQRSLPPSPKNANYKL